MAYNLMLEAVIGSTAYGLATENSDIDKQGIFIRDIYELIGLFSPQESIVTHNPDITHHELGKFFNLAGKSNPTVLEILYATNYTFKSELGDFLISRRDAFPSTTYVRSAYRGYCDQQLNKLINYYYDDHYRPEWPDKKLKKLGRHATRLLIQERQLLETGELTLDVSEHSDYIFGMGLMAVTDFDGFHSNIRDELERLDNLDSVLQDKPDWGELDELVQYIRWTNHTEGVGPR